MAVMIIGNIGLDTWSKSSMKKLGMSLGGSYMIKNMHDVESATIKSFPMVKRNVEMMPTVATRAAFAKISWNASFIAVQKPDPFMATTMKAFLARYTMPTEEYVLVDEFETLLEKPQETLAASHDNLDKFVPFLCILRLVVEVFEGDSYCLNDSNNE